MLFGDFFAERKEMVGRIGAGTMKKFFFGTAIVAHQIAHVRVGMERIRFQRGVDLTLFD